MLLLLEVRTARAELFELGIELFLARVDRLRGLGTEVLLGLLESREMPAELLGVTVMTVGEPPVQMEATALQAQTVAPP
jgi:hypothetical protein